jgi:hypothetical protein
MTKYRHLAYEPIPCWTRLVWMPPDTIGILIHARQQERLNKLPEIPTPEQVATMPDRNTLVRMPEENGFIPIHLCLPCIRQREANVCDTCKGKGKIYEDGDACFYCDGFGYRMHYDWPAIFPLAKQASQLLDIVSCPPETDGVETHPQLLTATICAAERQNGIWGTFSRELVKYLPRLMENDHANEIICAMKDAHIALTGFLEDFLVHEFHLWQRSDNGIVMSCPGDACEIHPDDLVMNLDGGYELTCHNIDSPIQSLTLLAGLAALETQARRELCL